MADPGPGARRSPAIATAGHIDHGKTALVEALTGERTDRLAEERRRGISIELGFAALELPRAGRVSLIDVPGHEALVRTMVAGAGGVSLWLLAVAADDGPMPQTHEHLGVLRALGVDRGVIALTRSDLADAQRRRRARAEVEALGTGAPIVEVSSPSGEGIAELRARLDELVAEHSAADPDPGPRPPASVLHADRVFTLPGAGTVATGTLRGGVLRRGDELHALPAGGALRVRSLQVHDADVELAAPGRRVAVALTGSAREDVGRGDALVPAGSPLTGSWRLDVELLLEPAAGALGGERIQVHHGTRETPARVVAIAPGIAQLRLEERLVCRPRERVVLRRIAPPGTLGGAIVLDPAPRRHGEPARSRLELLARGSAAELTRAALDELGELATDPASWPDAAVCSLAWERFDPGEWRRALERLATEPGLDLREGRIRLPQPPSPEPAEQPLDRLDRILIAIAERDGDRPRSPADVAAALRLDQPALERRLDALARRGLLARIGRDIFLAPGVLAELERRAVEHARRTGELTLAGLRDELGSSRRHVQALLEHLDAERITVRRGDRRVLRGRG